MFCSVLSACNVLLSSSCPECLQQACPEGEGHRWLLQGLGILHSTRMQTCHPVSKTRQPEATTSISAEHFVPGTCPPPPPPPPPPPSSSFLFDKEPAAAHVDYADRSILLCECPPPGLPLNNRSRTTSMRCPGTTPSTSARLSSSHAPAPARTVCSLRLNLSFSGKQRGSLAEHLIPEFVCLSFQQLATCLLAAPSGWCESAVLVR
eukprot:COSAG06_NODE_1719_length_8590_cov_18.960311_3_plen_206_part_00